MMQRMSAAEYRELIVKQAKRLKHNNTKIQFEGVVFDSEGELARWRTLQLLERVGKIDQLYRQLSFHLLDPEKGVRGSIWFPDFCYYDAENDLFVAEDFKYYTADGKGGTAKDKSFRLKIKLFHKRYPWFDVRISSSAKGIETIYKGDKCDMSKLVLDERMTVKILEVIRDEKNRSMEEIAALLRNRGPMSVPSVCASMRKLIQDGFFKEDGDCWHFKRINFQDTDYLAKNRRMPNNPYCQLDCKLKSVLSGKCTRISKKEFNGKLSKTDSGMETVCECDRVVLPEVVR